jgi:hypothetical protein
LLPRHINVNAVQFLKLLQLLEMGRCMYGDGTGAMAGRCVRLTRVGVVGIWISAYSFLLLFQFRCLTSRRCQVVHSTFPLCISHVVVIVSKYLPGHGIVQFRYSRLIVVAPPTAVSVVPRLHSISSTIISEYIPRIVCSRGIIADSSLDLCNNVALCSPIINTHP